MSYVAQQVRVDAAELSSYDWSGRTIKYRRAQIREASGFREATRSDEDHLAAWLSEEVCPVELAEDRLREAPLARRRAERIEPPGRLEWVLAAASATFDRRFCAGVVTRLSGQTQLGLEKLIALRACPWARFISNEPGSQGKRKNFLYLDQRSAIDLALPSSSGERRC